MKLKDATLFITGANRGLGLAFARIALERGARKVYAAARDPAQVSLPGVVPVRLDVKREDDVREAARRCDDVTLVINNAGIAGMDRLLDANGMEATRRHMETNMFGMLALSQAFAPVLRQNGGGALINVLSAVSFAHLPALSAYSVSKTAAWGLTNALRNELRAQQTQVLALHVGFMDTDLARGFDVPKTPPELVVGRSFDALEAGASEVLADEVSERLKQGLSRADAVYLQAL